LDIPEEVFCSKCPLLSWDIEVSIISVERCCAIDNICHSDANQANKEMTKDAHYEKSSKQSSEDLTKDLANLTKGRNEHKPEHLMLFLLVFLNNKTNCK